MPTLCSQCHEGIVLLTCWYCPLSIYCSPSCAASAGAHPCKIARMLWDKNIPIPATVWNQAENIHLLDQLFSMDIASESFEELVKYHTGNAFLYLMQRVDDLFVWPHEKESHEHWLSTMAQKLSPLVLGFEFNIDWYLNPNKYMPVCIPFAKSSADFFISSMDTQFLYRFLFSEEERVYIFLLRLAMHASLPYVICIFNEIKNLQITQENCPQLFISPEGRNVLIPPVNVKMWSQAISKTNEICIPKGQLFSRKRKIWQNARFQFMFYRNRQQELLQIIKARYPNCHKYF